MDTDTKTIYSNTLFNPTEVLETIPRITGCEQVKAEFLRWFDFSPQNHKYLCASFTGNSSPLFTDEIPDPIIVYILTNQKFKKEKTMNANVLINQWVLVICPPE